MADDAFDRAVRREEELRAQLAAGAIDDAELDAMRGFDQRVTRDVRLTVDEARRLVDEGADPAAVAEIVEYFSRISVGEAIDLVAAHGLEGGCIRELVDAGVSRRLDVDAVTEIFDYEIDAALLALIVDVGFEPPEAVTIAVELADTLDDPHDTLRSLRRAGLSGLTVDQIATIADHEINPKVVRRLLDGDPDLGVGGALNLLTDDEYDSDENERGGRHSIGWTVDPDVAREWSIAAVKVGSAVVRDIARAVSAGLRGRSA